MVKRALIMNEDLHELGEACPKGHLFEETGLCLRYKSSGRCVSCRREGTRKWADENPVEVKRRQQEYYDQHKDEVKAQSKAWAKGNPEQRAAIVARYETAHAEDLQERRRIKARAARTRYPVQLRARTLINTLVRRGKLPHPNSLPCTDCGHSWKEGDSRHEYDHYAGYEGALARSVEAVCRPCHALRTALRKGEQAA